MKKLSLANAPARIRKIAVANGVYSGKFEWYLPEYENLDVPDDDFVEDTPVAIIVATNGDEIEVTAGDLWPGLRS